MQNLFDWMIQVRNVRKISQDIEIISNGVILKELQRVKIWVGSWDVVFRRKKITNNNMKSAWNKINYFSFFVLLETDPRALHIQGNAPPLYKLSPPFNIWDVDSYDSFYGTVPQLLLIKRSVFIKSLMLLSIRLCRCTHSVWEQLCFSVLYKNHTIYMK